MLQTGFDVYLSKEVVKSKTFRMMNLLMMLHKQRLLNHPHFSLTEQTHKGSMVEALFFLSFARKMRPSSI